MLAPLESYPIEVAISELTHEVQRTEVYARRALQRVNPSTIRTLGHFQVAASRTRRRDYFRDAGFSRLVWAVGAAGGGHGEPGAGLAKFLDLAAQWSITELLLAEFADMAVGRLSGMAWQSALARTRSTHSTFWWAALSICRSLLRHAAHDGAPESVADELPKYVARANTPYTIGTGLAPLPAASAAFRAFASDCSVPLGAYSGLSLDELFYSTRNLSETRCHIDVHGDNETHPFIRDGDLIIPASIAALCQTPHIVVLSYLRRLLGDNQAATCFENACIDVLSNLINHDNESVAANVYVKLVGQRGRRGSKDVGQTDFAVRMGSTLILGEVKSSFLSPHYRRTPKDYSRDIKKTHLQLGRRIEAVKSGTPISIGGHTVNTKKFDDVRGLGVVMHDYGNGIWNADHLDEIRADYGRQPIVTIHDLAVLSHTLKGLEEFVSYLVFRDEVLAEPHHIALEELDLLAAFLEGADGYRADILDKRRDAKPGGYLYMRPRAVPDEMRYIPREPTDQTTWRRTVANFEKLQFAIDRDWLSGRADAG